MTRFQRSRRSLLVVVLLLWAPAPAISGRAGAQQVHPGAAADTPAGRDLERDLATLRSRLLASLVPADPGQRRQLADSARALLAEQKGDGSWPDIDYADRGRAGWAPREHLFRLRALAQASRVDEHPAPLPALRQGLSRGLDFWLAHDPQSDNWWHNQIGAPLLLGETLLLIEDRLSPRQRERGIDRLRRSGLVTTTGGRRVTWTGANLVWMAGNMILRGLLEASPATIEEALRALFSEVEVTEVGSEGIQADLSFHQHGPVLYTGGYGASYLGDVVRFVRFAHGTRWQVGAEQRDLLERFVLEGVAPTVRGGFYDFGVTGRELTRPGKSARSLNDVVAALAELPGPRQQELRALATRLRGDAEASEPTLNRHFWRSDYMVHHRPEFFISVRMHSTRTGATDQYINGEGKKSHHLADGVTLIHRRGDEYADIFPAWDWRRIPGATIEQEVARQPQDVGARGRTSWVGGVSDGRYGMAAMDLARDSLRALKAWFLFDEGMVALGAGIRNPGERPVVTSVQQSLLRGPVSDTVLHAGRGALRVVRHDGVAYLFPAGTDPSVRAAVRTGSWAEIGAGSPEPVSREVFSLWIDHGPGPRDASYRYLVAPGDGDPLRFAADAVVVSNTAAVQAVHHRGAGILQAAFRRPGTLDAEPGFRIEADQPCLLMLRETPGGVELSVADPAGEAQVVNVLLDRALAEAPGVEARPGGGTRVRVQLPGGAGAGGTVMRALRSR